MSIACQLIRTCAPSALTASRLVVRAASFPPSRQQFPSPCHSPQHQPYSPQAHPQRPPPAPRPVRMFSYSELETATYGFAESRRLGGGGFGQVYKGFLDGGQDAVAVKLLDAGGQQVSLQPKRSLAASSTPKQAACRGRRSSTRRSHCCASCSTAT